jgi:hypothetical protein
MKITDREIEKLERIVAQIKASYRQELDQGNINQWHYTLNELGILAAVLYAKQKGWM